jgi:hypothetical protein
MCGAHLLKHDSNEALTFSQLAIILTRVVLGILERLLLVILQTNMTVHFIIDEIIKKKKILLSNLIRIGNGDQLFYGQDFILLHVTV